MNTTKLLSHLRKSGRLIICQEHDGSLWASDSYMAVRVVDKSPITDLLADYNLPLEPMVCDAWRTLKRRSVPSEKAPDIGAQIPTPADWQDMTRETLGGAPVFIESTRENGLLEVWRLASGGYVSLAVDKANVVRALTPQASVWHGVGSTKPAVFADEDGRVGAILMPVRTLLDEMPAEKPKARSRKKAA